MLLETAKQILGEGSLNKFVHISMDEVYGTLIKIVKLILNHLGKIEDLITFVEDRK